MPVCDVVDSTYLIIPCFLFHRCVRLGLDRKNGGDSFLKLFAQMYVNNECVAFSLLYTPLSAVPELTGNV